MSGTIYSGLAGHKNKPCKGSDDGLHRWTTWEGKTDDGRHIKRTVCKNCGRQP